jgi:hypothetical protein
VFLSGTLLFHEVALLIQLLLNELCHEKFIAGHVSSSDMVFSVSPLCLQNAPDVCSTGETLTLVLDGG